MPVSSLLNIAPDKLFDQSSILEIEDVQKRLQGEIDRKHEELRTMVGERYRDFIEAADTISQMKILSEKIIEDINKIKASTADLQVRQVSGFKIEFHLKDMKNNNSWACAASQIKILIDLVEHIWDAVDSSNFIHATLLFLLARYLKISLEINPNYKTTQHFPIVSHLWSSTVHFKDTVLNGAEEMLKSQHNSQVSCNALLSIALLENLSACQLLERYLSIRFDALHAMLSSEQSINSDIIQQRLCNSYVLLINSIVVVFHCFVENVQSKEGLIWKQLQMSVGPQAPFTVQLLKHENDIIPNSLLPSSIKEFRPSLAQPVEPISDTQVYEIVSSWLVRVQGFVREHGSFLLQRLSSLRSLQGLRSAPVVCDEWSFVAQRLLQLPNVDVWTDLYRSLITVRAEQLLSVHWDAALKTLKQKIQQAYESASTEIKQTEEDLRWYMWKESVGDPNDLKIVKGQAKGVTPRVTQLCAALELKICSLLHDLDSLCPEQEVDPRMLAISHKLKVHQQITCSKLVSGLVQFVRSLVEEATSKCGVMLLAKFLQSVPELCPSLSKCLTSTDTKSSSWEESHMLLQTECVAAYKAWLKLTSSHKLKHVLDTLGTDMPNLHSIPQWEEISIEEEGESGEKLQSVLKVPSFASLNLLHALYYMASVVSHLAVPKQTSEQLMNLLLKTVIDVYNKNLQKSLTQTQYSQMLLDIKYLAQLMNAGCNKDLKNFFQETIVKLESKVDPFDLNVLTPYINNNVKMTVYQTQTLFGGSSLLSSISPRSEEPGVLALSSSGSTWFPLLHITAPRASTHLAKPKSKKVGKHSSPNNSSETVSKQSSASSFFGAMATDWFG